MQSEALKKWECAVVAGGSSCIEAGLLAGFNVGKGESASLRSIRTVSKAFHHLENEQCGWAGEFAVFIQSRGIEVLVPCFRGNRGYVMFPGGSVNLHRRLDFVDFICSLEMPNRLFVAILADVQSVVTMAGCHALGILDFI
jgi:hypothetical protein